MFRNSGLLIIITKNHFIECAASGLHFPAQRDLLASKH